MNAFHEVLRNFSITERAISSRARVCFFRPRAPPPLYTSGEGLMAAKKKTGTTKKTAPATKGRAKVGKVMHEFKHGELKSGGKRKVKNPKQAIAIGLSEARRAGADIPAKRPVTAKRKSAGSRTQPKTAVKKATVKKAATKKTVAKKTVAKKSVVRKTAAKKSPRK
jgi:hypothetical protein